MTTYMYNYSYDTIVVFCAGETDSKWRLVYPNTAVAMVVSRPCPDSQSVSTGKSVSYIAMKLLPAHLNLIGGQINIGILPMQSNKRAGRQGVAGMDWKYLENKTSMALDRSFPCR